MSEVIKINVVIKAKITCYDITKVTEGKVSDIVDVIKNNENDITEAVGNEEYDITDTIKTMEIKLLVL